MLNVSTSYSCPLILLLNTFEKYIKNKIHQNDLSGGPGEKIIRKLGLSFIQDYSLDDLYVNSFSLCLPEIFLRILIIASFL